MKPSFAPTPLLAVLAACSAEEGKDGTIDVIPGDDTGSISPPLSDDWCDRVAGGPPAEGDAILALAALHGGVRHFGAAPAWSSADAALVAALGGEDAAEPDLEAYVEGLTGACLVAASDSSLGPAQVEQVDGVAWVRPGTGAVELPEGAEALVLDLRDLPAADGLDEALASAASLALATEMPGARSFAFVHYGYTDQVFSPSNVYSVRRGAVDDDPLPAGGTADLPMAILTDGSLPPAAARLAGHLRLQRRAWIAGEDVLTAVAEASWGAVGAEGVAWKSRDLYSEGERWPDAIPADAALGDPEATVAELLAKGDPPEVTGSADRIELSSVDPWTDEQPSDLDRATLRAMLIVGQGVIDRFYPFAASFGSGAGDRLVELLAEVDSASDPTDRAFARWLLQRYSNALTDGHGFVFDMSGAAGDTVGYLSAMLEDVDGRPVVRRTNHPGLSPGDTITAIDGVSVESWLATEAALVSANSEGYLLDRAMRELVYMEGDSTFTLLDAAGVTRTETVSPEPYETLEALHWVASDRASGWLDDLGRPDVYYLNLHWEVEPDTSAVKAEIAEAATGSGLVIDMRGYPGVDHYSVARALISGSFSSPIFEVPTWSGTDRGEVDVSSYEMEGNSEAFAGPAVLLVGHHTVSGAENFSTMLVGAGRVTVVGRQSAATNGNITGIHLPGDFGLTFTGMEVLFPDGSDFQGVGIVPDVEVELTAEAFAAGEDPELEAAVGVVP